MTSWAEHSERTAGRGVRPALSALPGLLELGQSGPLALLLAAMVLVVCWALVSTGWTEGLEAALWAGLGGLAAGLLLGWSAFPGSASHLLGAAYGVAWVGFLLGRDLPGNLTWGDRIRELAGHLGYWLQQAFSGGTGRDELIFVLFLAALAWSVAYNAAWNTSRRVRLWLALLPLSVAALAIVYYYVGPAPLTRYLVLYLFLALLYLGRTHVLELQERWRRERVAYTSELQLRAWRAALLVAVLVLALAWLLPGAAAQPRLAALWRLVSGPWQTVQEEWQRLFSTLSGPEVSGLVEPFGTSLTLGGPQNPRAVLVMDVAAPRAGRYYWRGAVYDVYASDRWTATENERMLLLPRRRPPGLEPYAARRPITQTITSYVPGRSMLVAAAQWVQVDREAEAYVDLANAAPLDFIRVFSVLPLEPGASYSALSLVSQASAASLRAAGTAYPVWIEQRYLQLPGSLPDRVRALAAEVSAGAATPYDRALALEGYLRTALTYDLAPPALPAERDYVDFLLFGSRRDYCNGYASAMVVMARTLGIPARLAVGYGQGEYDATRGVFRVRENNAHSWPELFFPGYGWIEFEPTASELPFVRPETPAAPEDLPAGAGRDLSEQEGLAEAAAGAGAGAWQVERLPRGAAPGLWAAAAVLAMAALAAGGWWALENWGLRRLAPAELGYARLLRLGRWLGYSVRPAETPWEWSRALAASAPAARAPIERLVEAYLRLRFARGPARDAAGGAAWPRARAALLAEWLRRRLPTFLRGHATDGRRWDC